MLIKILIFICLISASLTFAQDSIETVQPVPANSIVRGRVFYEDTGRPVRRAAIMLMSKARDGRDLSGITDSEGYFQIKNVRAGEYFPVVNAPGVVSLLAYADLSRIRSEGMEDATAGMEPILVNGISAVDVNIPARRGGAISGRVNYADGDPAIGVRVEVLRKVDDSFLPVIPNMSSIVSLYNGGAGVYQTDDRGYFRSAGLPAGKYIVRVTEKGSHSERAGRDYSSFESSILGGTSLLTTYYPDVFETSLAQVVELETGQENPEITVTIPDRELRKMSGKVVSAKDKIPFKNVQVLLRRKEEAPNSIFNDFGRSPLSTYADEKGNWSFEQLPKGVYELEVSSYNSNYDEIENVYGSNSPHYATNSNSGGRASAKKVKEVKFARKIQEITIEDKDLADVTIELVPGGSISGTVTVEKSKDFPQGVDIKLFDENQELASTGVWTSTLSDETTIEKYIDRDFELERIPAGKMFLRIAAMDDKFYVKSVKLNADDLLANPIDLKEGQILRNVQIVLAMDTGTVKGKVLTDKNDPASKAEVMLVPADPAKRRNSTYYRKAVTNENGEFEARVAPGEYVVFFKNEVGNRKGENFYKALDEIIKNADRVKVEAGGLQKISLKAWKAPSP